MPSHLEIEDVSKAFDDVPALDRCSLVVNAGEIVTLLGASGSGKTTLLWAVAGLLRPDHGRIRLCGRDITGLRPSRRGVGLVFQNYALFPHLSVLDNIAYGLHVRGVGRQEIARRMADVVELLALDGLGQRLPATLSGGQQQRVAVARSLILEPDLILLDEPFNALDAKLRGLMQVEIQQLMRRLGMTALIVTHDQAEALAISDRIAVLQQGRIRQTGSPLSLYQRPVDLHVAGFIGSANILHRTADRGVVQLAEGIAIKTAHQGSVAVVIRPENIRLTVAATQPSGFEGCVAAIKPLGPVIGYEIDVGWPEPLQVTTFREPDAAIFVERQRVSLSLRDPGACVVLEAP